MRQNTILNLALLLPHDLAIYTKEKPDLMHRDV